MDGWYTFLFEHIYLINIVCSCWNLNKRLKHHIREDFSYFPSMMLFQWAGVRRGHEEGQGEHSPDQRLAWRPGWAQVSCLRNTVNVRQGSLGRPLWLWRHIKLDLSASQRRFIKWYVKLPYIKGEVWRWTHVWIWQELGIITMRNPAILLCRENLTRVFPLYTRNHALHRGLLVIWFIIIDL